MNYGLLTEPRRLCALIRTKTKAIRFGILQVHLGRTFPWNKSLLPPSHAEVVEALLTKFENITVDARNKQGITPLIKACVTGKAECAKLLVDKGADPLARDPRRQLTGAQWAYLCGWPACARVLEARMMAAGMSDSLRDSLQASPGPRRDSCTSQASDDDVGRDKVRIFRSSSEPDLRRASESPWLRNRHAEILGPNASPGRCSSLLDVSAVCRPVDTAAWRTDDVPSIRILEVEAPVDPIVVQYGDPVPPDQQHRQENQVVSLCLPGMGKGFAYE